MTEGSEVGAEARGPSARHGVDDREHVSADVAPELFEPRPGRDPE
ncbi:hypothetical protein ACFO0N_08800 [Halobium salinum]|uniref:Uncharacterized protein n=1 Tax=Halobium salinum TaxID=1364940 RepID=A0ABD5PBE9_9EURY|nr:hypothetical protein [Halobium salinum]